MRYAQEKYIRECFEGHRAVTRMCRHCGPPTEPTKKTLDDALFAVATYVDSIAVPKGFPAVCLFEGTCDVMGHGHTWEGGVFEADSFGSGVRKWYWRVMNGDKEVWANTPEDALIDWVTAIEKHVGADPAARALQFVVRMPEVSCRGDDHQWKFLYEGRHGSNKGVEFYECIICKKSKDV